MTWIPITVFFVLMLFAPARRVFLAGWMFTFPATAGAIVGWVYAGKAAAAGAPWWVWLACPAFAAMTLGGGCWTALTQILGPPKN